MKHILSYAMAAFLFPGIAFSAEENAKREEILRLEKALDAFSQISSDLQDSSQEPELFVYQCKHITASTMRKLLEDFLSSHGTVTINEETDQLIVAETPKNLALLKKIIEQTDRFVPQVLVEAQIVEFVVDNDFEKELQHAFESLDPSTSFATSIQSILNTPGANPNGSEGTQFTLLPWKEESKQLTSFLRYLDSNGHAEILSAPNLVIRRGSEGAILTGDDVPIVTTEVVNGNPKTTTKFRSTGIKLTVKPIMVVDDSVRIEVNPEVSDVTGEVRTGDVSNPVISVRQVRTELNVKDGQTIAIGGLLSSKDRKTERRVPILSSIPILGPLFKSERKEETEIQLVVFLRISLIKEGVATQPISTLPEKVQDTQEEMREGFKKKKPTFSRDVREFIKGRE